MRLSEINQYLSRFATLYIEKLHPDLILDKDPYLTVESLLVSPESGLFFTRDTSNALVFNVEPYYGDKFKVLVTKELVRDILFLHEVFLKRYTTILTISKEDFAAAKHPITPEADWVIEVPKQAPDDSVVSTEYVYQLIKLQDRALVDALSNTDITQ